MADILKILMMGGQRSGKSSMLAGLLETMLNGKVKELVTVEDMTARSGTGLDLSRNIRDLKLRLLMTQDKSFLIDDENNKTNAFSDYLLEFAVPGTSSRMQMLFSDVNGEFYDKGQIHDTEISKLIRECDVFLVAIDTPFLMEAVNPSNRLCNESINLSYNHVRDLEDFFTELDDKDGADAKLVIFVPLKCEKWAKEPNGLNRVTQRVKEVFATHIKNLSAYAKMNITILPMLTAGNINFVEFHDAYIYNSIDGAKRCCKIDIDKVRTEFGDVEPMLPGETINEDSEAVIAGTNLMRPFSWYQITPGNNSYAPRNCDQLPLHIIRFMLAKLIDAEENSYKGFFGSILKFLKTVFGTMDIDELKRIIGNMQRNGVIKDKGDGIEIIKRF